MFYLHLRAKAIIVRAEELRIGELNFCFFVDSGKNGVVLTFLPRINMIKSSLQARNSEVPSHFFKRFSVVESIIS